MEVISSLCTSSSLWCSTMLCWCLYLYYHILQLLMLLCIPRLPLLWSHSKLLAYPLQLSSFPALIRVIIIFFITFYSWLHLIATKYKIISFPHNTHRIYQLRALLSIAIVMAFTQVFDFLLLASLIVRAFTCFSFVSSTQTPELLCSISFTHYSIFHVFLLIP